MKTLDKITRLKNMMSCLSEIEGHCTDLTPQQLNDLKLLKTLHYSFTILGMEAESVRINHPIFETLSSFKGIDFTRDFASDQYALYNFIMNDLDLIKETVSDHYVTLSGGTDPRGRTLRWAS